MTRSYRKEMEQKLHNSSIKISILLSQVKDLKKVIKEKNQEIRDLNYEIRKIKRKNKSKKFVDAAGYEIDEEYEYYTDKDGKLQIW